MKRKGKLGPRERSRQLPVCDISFYSVDREWRERNAGSGFDISLDPAFRVHLFSSAIPYHSPPLPLSDGSKIQPSNVRREQTTEHPQL